MYLNVSQAGIYPFEQACGLIVIQLMITRSGQMQFPEHFLRAASDGLGGE